MRRVHALLVVLLLTTASCGGADDRPPAARGPDGAPSTPLVTPDDGSVDEGESGAATPRPGGSDGRGGGDGGAGTDPTSAPGGGGDGGDRPAAHDGAGVGANALVYLRGSWPALHIEVDAVAGNGPEADALNHLRGILDQVLDKPDGIRTPVTTIPSSDHRYSNADIEALERRHRNTSSTGGTASLYVLYLDGRYEPDDSVLGLAFGASTFVVFKQAIRSAGNPLVSASRIERSVVLHEAGHLLRLINIGYTSPRDHEDPDHRHHSRNRGSVMFWAVESDLVSTVLDGPPPDDFDADDRADLADLKAGRL